MNTWLSKVINHWYINNGLDSGYTWMNTTIISLTLIARKLKEVMFSPMCVYLFVRNQDNF